MINLEAMGPPLNLYGQIARVLLPNHGNLSEAAVSICIRLT